jgi:hypothetical protein
MRLILVLLLAALAGAAEWPATVNIAGQEVALRGSGRLTWAWWKIYDVALHAPAGSDPIAAATPRRLAFRYLRDFSAEDLGKATSKTARERIGSAPAAEVEAGITAINALWPAVVEGDELTLTYSPGQGTTVAHNGTPRGTVAGDAFAGVLFAIWLGADPIDEDLRQELAGTR